MDLLSGLHWEICLVYLDDILIFSKTFSEHLHRLKIVFEKLKTAGLKLRLEKCRFAQKSVTYLGYIIQGGGISPDPKKISAMKEMKAPSNVEQVKRFLGLTGYYRRFVENYSRIVEPLHMLLRRTSYFAGQKNAKKNSKP